MEPIGTLTGLSEVALALAGFTAIVLARADRAEHQVLESGGQRPAIAAQTDQHVGRKVRPFFAYSPSRSWRSKSLPLLCGAY